MRTTHGRMMRKSNLTTSFIGLYFAAARALVMCHGLENGSLSLSHRKRPVEKETTNTMERKPFKSGRESASYSNGAKVEGAADPRLARVKL
jgi:hypothetical protein